MAVPKFITVKGSSTLTSTPFYTGLVQHESIMGKKSTYAHLAEKLAYSAANIRATFESSDVAFNPAVNSLELAFRLADDVENVLVDATPRIVTDETSTKVRVDNVADVETPRPYQVIHGQHVFKVTGINLVTTDTGAAVWPENNLGVTFPSTVQSVISKQKFTAKSATLFEGGDYKLWVRTRSFWWTIPPAGRSRSVIRSR